MHETNAAPRLVPASAPVALAIFLGWGVSTVSTGSAGTPPTTCALGTRLTTTSLVHVVRPGDTLTSVGARHGIEPRVLARQNGLASEAWLHVGQRLRVETRHVVPSGTSEGIVVNVPQRLLFVFRAGELVATYPVGVGRPGWPTPIGTFEVRDRRVDKPWIVPRSIQREMEVIARADGLARDVTLPGAKEHPLEGHGAAFPLNLVRWPEPVREPALAGRSSRLD